MQGMVIYCERAGDGLWAEPFNALSSLAFMAAGLATVHYYRARIVGGVRCHWDLVLLIALVFTTGIGGLVAHVLNTPWTEWADGMPMSIFLDISVVVFLYRVVGLRTLGVVGGLILFQWSMVAAGNLFPLGSLNGSLLYLPSLIALSLMSGYGAIRFGARAWPFALGAGLLAVAMFLRSVDLEWCPHYPIGTHFLWHLVASVVAYLVLRGLMSLFVHRRIMLDGCRSPERHKG